MPFDLKNMNPAERFYYPDYAAAMEQPESKREWVELRLCVGQVLKEIEAKTTVKKVEHVQPLKKSGKTNLRAPLQRIEYNETDDVLHTKLTFDYTIYGWQFFEPDGKPISCTAENKEIMLDILEFNQFVGESLEAMIEGGKQRSEDQESNLPITANGSQNSQAAGTAEKRLKSTEKSPTAEAV